MTGQLPNDIIPNQTDPANTASNGPAMLDESTIGTYTSERTLTRPRASSPQNYDLVILSSFGGFYLTLLFFAVVTTITEWKRINTTAPKKILYTVTFPLFIFTYIPIAIVALFRKIEWKPIAHTINKSIEEI